MPQFGWPQTSKPGRGATIDGAHPLRAGLISFWALNEGAGKVAYDAASGGSGAFGAGGQAPAWSSSPAGTALAFSAASDQFVQASSPPPPPTAACTFFALGSIDAATSFGMLLAWYQDQGTHLGAQLRQSGTSGKPEWQVGYLGGGFAGCSASTSYADGLLHSFVGTYDGAAVKLYIDGVRAASSSGSGAIVYGSSPFLMIGDGPGGFGSTARIAAAGIWSRALSADEVRSLSANPWQLFAPGPLRSWASLQGSGTLLGSSAGGAVAGGSAAPSIAFAPAAAGGAVAGGAADPAAAFAGAAAGGAVAGGSAAGSGAGGAGGLGHWPQAGKPGRGATIDPANPLARGLVSCFALSECAGGVVADLARPGRVGTLTNGPAWSAGPYGAALSFAGGATNDFVGFSDAGFPVGAAPITVALRVRTASTRNQFAFQLGSNSPGGQLYIGAYDLGSGNHYIMGVGGPGTPNLDSGVAIDDGSWHHLAVLYDGAAWRMYLDGRAVASSSSLNAKSTALDGTAFVSNDDPTSHQDWTGQVDHLMVFGRALSPSEVSRLSADPWQVIRRRPILAEGAATFAGDSAGGAVAGASSSPSIAFAGESGGGPVAGGSAQGSSAGVFSVVAAGGPVAGGFASPSAAFTATAAGGPVAGGSAQGSSPGVFSVVAAGGAVAGGIAAPSALFAGASAGGAVAGGSASGTNPGAALAIGYWQAVEVLTTADDLSAFQAVEVP